MKNIIKIIALWLILAAITFAILYNKEMHPAFELLWILPALAMLVTGGVAGMIINDEIKKLKGEDNE